jgi:hypothetical protein
MGPRAAFSQVLIAGGFVLLVAIGIGIAMGNHVLSQVAGRAPIAPTPVPIPTPTVGDSGNSAAWKHFTILSVATDPAFPDPRITPEPEVVAAPKRTPAPKPSPTRTATGFSVPYTSPPLPIPLSTEGATPEAEETGGRLPNASRTTAPSRATLPPVPVPSLNP